MVFRVSSAHVLTLLLLAGLTAPGPATAQAPPTGEERAADSTAEERAALRAEAEVARRLARLDEALGLGTSPDASPEWPARLAATIEARGDDEPAQELLRGVAFELRGLEIGLPLGHLPDGATKARPAFSTPAGRQRADGILRLLEWLDVIERKLGRRGPANAGPGLSERSESSRVTARSHLPLGSDTCADATPLDVGYFQGSTDFSTVDGGSSCGGPTPTPDRWYHFTAPEAGTYTFETRTPAIGSGYDTVLSLHSDCPAGEDLHELACSDDQGVSLFSSLSHPMAAGEEVLVRVSGYDGATGDFQLAVEQGRTVSGTITREGSSAPLAGVVVELTDSGNRVHFEGVSGPDGTYTVSVPRTEVSFYALAHDPFSIAERWDDEPCPVLVFCTPTLGDPISIEADAGGIDFGLAAAGRVEGTVVEAGTGDPIPGALIRGFGDGTSYQTTVTTGSDGTFEISGMPPGGYRLLAVTPDHQDELWDDIPCESPCTIGPGTVLQVNAGDTLSGIDFALEAYPRVSGSVHREGTNEPIETALVTLHDDTGFPHGSAYTDSTGAYSAGVFPGTSFARTSTDLYLDQLFDGLPCEPSCDPTDGEPILLAFGDHATGIDFVLAPMASISGRTTDATTGAPVRIRLYLHDGNGTFLRSLRTSTDDPLFTFEGLEPDTYYLRAGYNANESEKTHEGELWEDIPCPETCDVTTGTAIVLGPSTQAAGLEVRLERRGRITGTIVDGTAGGPVGGVGVTAYFFPGGLFANSTVTATDGSYTIPNLAAGSYRVGTDSVDFIDEMFDDLPCSGSCDRTFGAEVLIETDTTTSGIDFSLERSGRLSGQVRRAGSQISAFSSVSLLDASGQVVDQDHSGGGFLFVGVDPGIYFLRTHSDDPTAFHDELWDDVPCDPDCDVAEGTPVVVEAGTVRTDLDFELAACPADSREEIVSATIDGYRKGLACDEIVVHETALAPGGELYLRSGRAVVFGDGFSVEDGGGLQVIIEPTWADD